MRGEENQSREMHDAVSREVKNLQNTNTKLLVGNRRADGEVIRKILRERMTSPNNGK